MMQAPSELRGASVREQFVSSDLPFEIARLQSSRECLREGHTGKTLTKSPALRVVLETMKAGARMTFHETDEQVTLQVLLGQLRVWMRLGENSDLLEGGFAAIEAGELHELEALEDCAFLVTLAWPPGSGREDDDSDGTGI